MFELGDRAVLFPWANVAAAGFMPLLAMPEVLGAKGLPRMEKEYVPLAPLPPAPGLRAAARPLCVLFVLYVLYAPVPVADMLGVGAGVAMGVCIVELADDGIAEPMTFR
jgi:hypothetical protein